MAVLFLLPFSILRLVLLLLLYIFIGDIILIPTKLWLSPHPSIFSDALFLFLLDLTLYAQFFFFKSLWAEFFLILIFYMVFFIFLFLRAFLFLLDDVKWCQCPHTVIICSNLLIQALLQQLQVTQSSCAFAQQVKRLHYLRSLTLRGASAADSLIIQLIDN